MERQKLLGRGNPGEFNKKRHRRRQNRIYRLQLYFAEFVYFLERFEYPIPFKNTFVFLKIDVRQREEFTKESQRRIQFRFDETIPRPSFLEGNPNILQRAYRPSLRARGRIRRWARKSRWIIRIARNFASPGVNSTLAQFDYSPVEYILNVVACLNYSSWIAACRHALCLPYNALRVI